MCVSGVNLQEPSARVGSFYPVGSKGANSGWQGWWQVPTEPYHQPPFLKSFSDLLLFLFFLCPLPSPVTYYLECPTFCIWVTATLWCFNLNSLCHSLADMKLGLKSWLHSSSFIPSSGSLFSARILLQGSSREYHICSARLILIIVWLLTLFFSPSTED